MVGGCIAQCDGWNTDRGRPRIPQCAPTFKYIYQVLPTALRLQRSFPAPGSAACRGSLSIPGQRRGRPHSNRRPGSTRFPATRQHLAAVRPAAIDLWGLHPAAHTASAAASNTAEAATADAAGAPHIGSENSDVVLGNQATTTAQTAEAGETLGRDFDWRSEWYPVSFSQNIPEGELVCAAARAGSLNTPYIPVVPDRWMDSSSDYLH